VGALEQAAEARIAAAKAAAASYTQQTGRDMPSNLGTPFGQAGGNVGTTASTPVTAGADYAQQLTDSKKEAQKLLTQAKKSGNKDAMSMAQMTLDNIKQAENLITLLGGTGGTGGGTGAFAGNRSDASYIAEGRSGTSNTGQKYINGKLVSESEFSKFLYGDTKASGGVGAGAPSTAGAEAQAARQNAFDILYSQFSQYGLEALVEPLKGLILDNVSPAEFAVRLRQTEPYKKRFAANAQRINKGLKALSEAEYLALEDGYQSIMRNYGLPATYYTKGDLGRQEGFEKFITGDVSPAELEERIMTAQNRVVNAPPQVAQALKQFYPDINNSDILAYTLDPEKGLADIRRKVTAAEIGGAAMGAGLATDVARAEELARFGVTAEKAREGYQAAVPIIERGRQLSGFYNESPYTQTTAEEELFGLTYAPEATAKRKRLTALEQASFAGQSGMTGGALSRDRAGSF
jgi:hypothetical protein